MGKNVLLCYKRGAPALDFQIKKSTSVIQQKTEIVPVEVKANTKGAMQSMYLFLEIKKCAYGIRFSLENFSYMKQVHIYPLYAVRHLFRS
jgi:hypothetical protein